MISHQKLQDWYDENQLSKTKILWRSLDQDGNIFEEASFEDVDLTAISVSLHLRNQHKIQSNERVLLMFHPGEQIEFIKCFLGCIYSNFIAVPISPPNPGLKNSLHHISKIIEDSGAKICISSSDIIKLVKSLMLTNRDSPIPKDFRWIDVDTRKLDKNNAKEEYESKPISIEEKDIIMLQYSSGSTGNPKGIMITQKNIFEHCLQLSDFCMCSLDTVALSWLPMFHDMGLMSSMFTPLINGPGLQLFLSPLAFLKNPTIWLEIITKYKVNVSGGPNFAYSILSKKFEENPKFTKEINLSSWKVAFCGAEPVRSSTIRDFSRVFAKYHFDGRVFCPLYGLGEATLMVSHPATRQPVDSTILSIPRKSLESGKIQLVTKGAGKEDSAVDVVGLGFIRPGTKFLVVNPETKTPCQELEIGEFWMMNTSVAAGYWKRPEQTEMAFKAYTSSGDGPFLRTGDLGFIYRQELFFTSRLKDLVIIDGVKYSPHDLEIEVELSHAFIRKGRVAVFALEVSPGAPEEIGVVAEIKRDLKMNKEVEKQISSSIQRQLFQTFSIPLHIHNIRLISPGTIPKTTSGKIQRFFCREMMRNNKLQLAGSKRSWNVTIGTLFNQSITVLFFLYLSIIQLFKNQVITRFQKSNHASKQEKNSQIKSEKQIGSSYAAGQTGKAPKVDNPPKNVNHLPKKFGDEEFIQKVKKMQETLISIMKESSHVDLTNAKDILTTPFFEMGFKSIDAVQICGKLEQISGQKISPTCFYEYYTLELLSKFLVDPENSMKSFELKSIAPTSDFRSIQKASRSNVQQKAFILGMSTANPEVMLDQRKIMEIFLETSSVIGESNSLAKFRKLFEGSAIQKRYVCAEPSVLSKLDTIKERNELYSIQAPLLASKAAKAAIADWGGDKSNITHVISVSCTGTLVPGLEFHLVEDLGLDRNAMRLGLNFMGCFGGLAGLRTAQSIALSNPDNRILLVCTELCSVQVQKDDLRNDNFVAESLFGDGAAAVIVGGDSNGDERILYEILKASCYALPNSKDKIRWDLSNTGWIVGLEHDIPFHLGQMILPFTKSLVDCTDINISELSFNDLDWCIHPGGKAIVELIEQKLGLSKKQTKSTWNVYENYGNMSSATVLFVLNDLRTDSLKSNDQPKEHIAGMAFGPGLAIEGMLFKRILK